MNHWVFLGPAWCLLRAGSSSGSINACEKTSFVFLRQELPVRLSNIMKEINLLPSKLLTTPSVQTVQSWWVTASDGFFCLLWWWRLRNASGKTKEQTASLEACLKPGSPGPVRAMTSRLLALFMVTLLHDWLSWTPSSTETLSSELSPSFSSEGHVILFSGAAVLSLLWRLN